MDLHNLTNLLELRELVIAYDVYDNFATARAFQNNGLAKHNTGFAVDILLMLSAALKVNLTLIQSRGFGQGFDTESHDTALNLLKHGHINLAGPDIVFTDQRISVTQPSYRLLTLRLGFAVNTVVNSHSNSFSLFTYGGYVMWPPLSTICVFYAIRNVLRQALTYEWSRNILEASWNITLLVSSLFLGVILWLYSSRLAVLLATPAEHIIPFDSMDELFNEIRSGRIRILMPNNDDGPEQEFVNKTFDNKVRNSLLYATTAIDGLNMLQNNPNLALLAYSDEVSPYLSGFCNQIHFFTADLFPSEQTGFLFGPTTPKYVKTYLSNPINMEILQKHYTYLAGKYAGSDKRAISADCNSEELILWKPLTFWHILAATMKPLLVGLSCSILTLVLERHSRTAFKLKMG